MFKGYFSNNAEQCIRFGVGTYLGPMDELTDHRVTQGILKAVDKGVRTIDTAINYRGQRGERAVGEAIRRLVLSGKYQRSDFFVSTKGGFVPFEGEPTKDLKKLFEEQYVSNAVASLGDFVAGCHCMAPKFIANQIDRSRKNLGLETIDLYYLHNPETQLEEIPERLFYEKLTEAFEVLERAVDEQKIRSYGLATWSGLRSPSAETGSIQLERCLLAAERAAEKVRGSATKHHFTDIQLPINLAMPEAAWAPTQKFGHNEYPVLDAARKLGLRVTASAPLLQGRLCHGLPDFILKEFPQSYSQAHCALNFVASLSGVDGILIGMKDAEHVDHDLAAAGLPRLAPEHLENLRRVL